MFHTLCIRLLWITSIVVGFRDVASQDIAAKNDTAKNTGWYLPDHLTLQFAGNIGFLSAGAGYIFGRDRYHLTLMYGYSPASVTNSQVHTAALKNIFHLGRFPLGKVSSLHPYAGLALLFEVGGVSFLRLPEYYPAHYYFPKGIHVTGFAGVKFRHPFRKKNALFRGCDFYTEVGSVDVLIWYKAISGQVKLYEILDISAGINLLLHQNGLKREKRRTKKL